MKHVVFISLLMLPLTLQAEAYRADLKVGMSVPEVLKAWGPALDKSEFETRREELWKYPFGEVRFRQGTVARWSSETLVTREVSPVSLKPARLISDSSTEKSHSREAEALLGEILKEIPSGSPDTGPSSMSSPVSPIPGGVPPSDPRMLQKPAEID